MITLLDSVTQGPVRGATAVTTNALTYTSDDYGHIAVYEPGLMNKVVYFEISHPGYDAPAAGFDYRGKAFLLIPGGRGTVDMTPIPGATPPTQSFGDDASILADEPLASSGLYFRMRVLDDETQRGVPLVELAHPKGSYISDSDGWVALYLPSLMGETQTFTVKADGYQYENGQGAPTLDLTLVPGASAVLRVHRTNVAERLYRVTGEGIHESAVLLGEPAPLADPVGSTNNIMGSDSAQVAMYHGSLFWTWGDTKVAERPLGNFFATAATSELPERGGLDPDVGVDLRYFEQANGDPAAMAPMFPDSGATWLFNLVSLKDATGVEHLFAHYLKVPTFFVVAHSGLCRFNDGTKVFESVLDDTGEPFPSSGDHDFTVVHRGEPFVYVGPYVRFPAEAEAITDRSTYEVYSPFLDAAGTQVERDEQGYPIYRWRNFGSYATAASVDAGYLEGSELPSGTLTDVQGGDGIQTREGAVEWNAYRQKFIRIAEVISTSTSFLNESWYSEADTPMGPWVYARKVVSHAAHPFYNPMWHPHFSKQAGRIVYFEGTYWAWLDRTLPTPQFDYNQIMYRMDLGRDELVIPAAVYDVSRNDVPDHLGTKISIGRRARREGAPAVFFAPDRPGIPGTLPVYGRRAGRTRLSFVQGPGTLPVFYAYPPDASTGTSGQLTMLYEHHSEIDPRRTAYSTDPRWKHTGYSDGAPLALVWKSPIRYKTPLRDYAPTRLGACCR